MPQNKSDKMQILFKELFTYKEIKYKVEGHGI